MIRKISEWLVNFALALAVIYALFSFCAPEVEPEVVRETVVDTVTQVDTIAPTPRVAFVEVIDFDSGPVMIVEDSTGEGYACYP